MRKSWDGDSDGGFIGKVKQAEKKMVVQKEPISKEEAEKIIKDLRRELGPQLPDLVTVDEAIMKVLAEHFEIVENPLLYLAKKRNWEKLGAHGPCP